MPLSTEINPMKPVTGIFDRGTDEFNNSRDSPSQNCSFIRDESLPIETGSSSFSTPAKKKIVSEGSSINLTEEEEELFNILLEVMQESEITSTLRVAGGWVRDKLLATEEFRRGNARGANDSSDRIVDRLTSKFKGPSSGRQGTKVIGADSSRTLIDPHDVPVDIDIALDDMLGREFADHLNEWMTQHGRKKISVGVVLKNPEKSKHLETATMKVGKFWIDFVNLRAEEYTEDSRIPDLMRIGTPEEDSFRRDLTINSLFYNINTGEVEDFTQRGLNDLKKGAVATPLPALTTLLDDPLRVLRSVRFAARLRFTIDDALNIAAMDERVRVALALKVARERVGSEVDLMLRSQDPVGAMRLLINLNLASTVFPVEALVKSGKNGNKTREIFNDGLHILTTTHNHLCDCKAKIPIWCEKKRVSAAATYGVQEMTLVNDEESRRRLWYASFLKPLRDHFRTQGHTEQAKAGARQGKKASRSVIMKLMVDELKRPLRESESVEAIMKASDDFTNLLNAGCDLSATACLLEDIRVVYHGADDEEGHITCHMGQRVIDSATESDPLWHHAMELRLLVSKVLDRVGPLWRAAMILSLSEQLAMLENEQFSYTIEGDVFEESQSEMRIGIVQKYDSFAAVLMQLGLVGIWSREPLINGREVTSEDILPNLPQGPIFREIMDEQMNWMTTHPGGSKEFLIIHLRNVFREYI